MQRSRRKADAKAKELLEMQGKIDDNDILMLLRLWHFKRYRKRRNAVPSDRACVQSESLGLVRSRDGQFLLTKYTRKWNFFFQALCKWLENHYPTDVDERFPFTTTSLNLEFAARRCRDANNACQSISKSFGEFSNGFLKYWPNDDGTQELDEFADA